METTKKTYPRTNPYSYADRVMKVFVREVLRASERINLLPMDELNILGGTRDLTAWILEEVRKLFLLLGRYEYARARKLSPEDRAVKRKINPEWVEALLLFYDPVTKTVFTHEVYRKCERLGEAILATGSAEKEVREFLKTITRQVKQETITATDKARREGLRDRGTAQVIWLTRQDELRCPECGMLHGEIFDIDKVPDKPHPNCRCWVMPVRG